MDGCHRCDRRGCWPSGRGASGPPPGPAAQPQRIETSDEVAVCGAKSVEAWPCLAVLAGDERPISASAARSVPRARTNSRGRCRSRNADVIFGNVRTNRFGGCWCGRFQFGYELRDDNVGVRATSALRAYKGATEDSAGRRGSRRALQPPAHSRKSGGAAMLQDSPLLSRPVWCDPNSV